MLGHSLRFGSEQPVEFVGYAAATDASGNWSLSLSGLNIQAGDLGVVHTGSLEGYSTVTSSGFVLLERTYDYAEGAACYQKIMAGNETVVAGTGTSSTVSIFTLWRSAKLADVAITLVDSHTNNLSALSTVEGDALLIAAFTKGANSPGFTLPSGYTHIVTAGSGAFGNNGWAAYTLSPSVPSENPPSIGFDASDSVIFGMQIMPASRP